MQQNTIPFIKTNPLQALNGLARSLALPHEFAPQRLPSFPALERTAVMGFSTMASVDVSQGGTQSVTRGFMARQAAYPLWIEKNPGVCNYGLTYKLSEGTQTLTNATSLSIQTAQPSGTWVGSQTASSTQPGISAASGVSLPYIYPLVGVDTGAGGATLPFLWVPANSYVVFMIKSTAAASGAGSVIVDFEQWNAPEQASQSTALLRISIPVSVGNYSAGATTGSFGNKGLWLRPYLMTGSGALTWGGYLDWAIGFTNAGTVSVANASTDLWPTLTAGGTPAPYLQPVAATPEFQNSILPFASTRVTAVGSLFTNVTKLVNKEGVVNAARLVPATTDIWNFTVAQLTNVHPAEKAQLALEHGFYTFAPPSTDLVDFLDYTSVGALSTEMPVYRLDNASLVNAFAFSDPDTTTATNLAITLDWHIEFRTNSTLFQIGLSALPLETLHQAQMALVQLGFFYNNDNHGIIKGLILPKLMAFARGYAAIPRYIAKIANAAIPKRPPPPPKVSTTLTSRPMSNRRQRRRRGPPPPRPKPANPPRMGPPKRRGGLDMYLEKYGRR